MLNIRGRQIGLLIAIIVLCISIADSNNTINEMVNIHYQNELGVYNEVLNNTEMESDTTNKVDSVDGADFNIILSTSLNNNDKYRELEGYTEYNIGYSKLQLFTHRDVVKAIKNADYSYKEGYDDDKFYVSYEKIIDALLNSKDDSGWRIGDKQVYMYIPHSGTAEYKFICTDIAMQLADKLNKPLTSTDVTVGLDRFLSKCKQIYTMDDIKEAVNDKNGIVLAPVYYIDYFLDEQISLKEHTDRLEIDSNIILIKAFVRPLTEKGKSKDIINDVLIKYYENSIFTEGNYFEVLDKSYAFDTSTFYTEKTIDYNIVTEISRNRSNN